LLFICKNEKSQTYHPVALKMWFLPRRNPFKTHAEAFLPLLNELKFRIFQESQLKTNNFLLKSLEFTEKFQELVSKCWSNLSFQNIGKYRAEVEEIVPPKASVYSINSIISRGTFFQLLTVYSAFLGVGQHFLHFLDHLSGIKTFVIVCKNI